MNVLHRAAAAVVTSLAVGAALVPAGAAPAPADRERAVVRLTIDDGASGGRLVSKRAACERGVGVTVFSRDAGLLQFFGSDVSNRQGRWQTERLPRRIPTTAFAVAPGEAGCSPAQSATTMLLRQAARRTPVSISLRLRPGFPPQGRVVSRRASCESGTDVALFYRPDGRSPWTWDGARTTDEEGRYDFGSLQRVRGGGDGQIITVAIGSRRCAIAQSSPVVVGIG